MQPWSLAVTSAFVLVIVTWFILNLIRLHQHHRRVLVRLKKVESILEPYSRETIAADIDEISSKFLEIHGFGDAWREFKECLTIRGDLVQNAVNPREFLNEHELLFKNVDREIWRSGPQSLTGLGILGTFVGLMIGLFRLNLDNADDLVEATTQMIGGIWIAFATSAVGICLSIVLGSVGNKADHQLRMQYNRIIDRIDYLFIRHTPEMYLRSIENLNRRQLERTDELVQTSKSLANDLAEALVDPLTESFNSAMDENLKPAIDGLKDSIDAMADKLAGMNQDALEQMVAKFTIAMEGAAGEQRERLAESLAGAADTIGNSANMMNTILEQMNLTREKFEEGAILNEEATAEARSRLEEAATFQQELMGQLREVGNQLGERLTDLEAHNERQVAAASTLSTSIDEVTSAVGRANEVAVTLSAAMEQAEAKAQTILVTIGQQEHLAEEFNNIITSVRTTMSQFDQQAALLADAARDFQGVMDDLGDFGEDAESILEKSKLATESIIQANADTAGRVTALRQTIENASKVFQQGTYINENLSRTITEQRQVIDTFNQAVQQAASLWNTHSEGFTELDGAIREGIQRFTEDVNGALATNLRTYDEAMSSISGNLYGSVNELQAVMENLIDSINRNGQESLNPDTGSEA